MFISENNRKIELKHKFTTISAGFPSPAKDFRETKLDLNKHLVKNEASTYFVRVKGESMQGAGINDGDLLVVDRGMVVKNGHIVVATINGEFTVKRLNLNHGRTTLVPENDKYPHLEIEDGDEFEIWGVVTYAIHETL